MPLIIKKVPPKVAFVVTYQGVEMDIFHAYDEDLEHELVEGAYTADVEEGCRPKGDQFLADGVQGQFGFTEDGDGRDSYFFHIYRIFERVKDLDEFKHPTKRFLFEFEHSFIVQTALDHGLIGFDSDYRFVNTMTLDKPIDSCVGGVIMPYNKKEASNG